MPAKRKLVHVEGQQCFCLFGVKREASASDAGKVHDLVAESVSDAGKVSASLKATAAVAASAAVAESARAEASAAAAAETAKTGNR